MAKALDLEVIRHAIKDNRIIVTLDSDFHTLLAVMGASNLTIQTSLFTPHHSPLLFCLPALI